MNVLFLHTPKFNNYYKPIGHYSFVLFPPIGLLGLADFLVKNNHTAKIIHLGVEQHQHGPATLTGSFRRTSRSSSDWTCTGISSLTM